MLKTSRFKQLVKNITSIRISVKIDARVKIYIKNNLGAPFIIGFMIMLIISAINLTINNVNIAEKTAEYAYYSLVIGAVLQIISIIKKNKHVQ